ncbi:hypothetical protein GCM10027563_41570 [Parasphingorhabdus pacifica]
MSFGTDSFGLVGQVFAGEARQTSQQAAAEIQEFSELTRDLGSRVNEAAKDYQDTDSKNADCLGQVQP